jgi:hypothetical protein
MPVLYLRVSHEVHDYIVGLADDADVSITRAAVALLAEAKRRGWTVRGQLAVEDQDQEAAR